MIPLDMYIYVSMSVDLALFGDHLIFYTPAVIVFCVDHKIKLYNTNQHSISYLNFTHTNQIKSLNYTFIAPPFMLWLAKRNDDLGYKFPLLSLDHWIASLLINNPKRLTPPTIIATILLISLVWTSG